MTTDIEEQFQFRDLCECEDGDERSLSLRFRLLQFAVASQQL